MSVASFNSDLKKFARTVNLDIETVVRKVAFDIYKGVTQKTPVDTGRAKANWNMGYGNINYTVTENTIFTALPPPNGAGKKPIYITNNLPYINALENGSSTQAPNGMVSLTMNETQRMVRNVIR
jgi:hypothetical protein